MFIHSELFLQSAVSASHSFMSILEQNKALRASRVVEESICQSVSQSVGRWVSQLVSKSVSQFVSKSVSESVN